MILIKIYTLIVIKNLLELNYLHIPVNFKKIKVNRKEEKRLNLYHKIL
jgi:hypothetical protein